MKLIQWFTKKIFLNWEHPLYSKNLFLFCTRYLDLWYGDNNFDRNMNGEYRLLKEIIPGTRVIFDVGANVGDYSGEMLRIDAHVTIHAFEPDPIPYEKLKKLTLIANNLGLGDREETKKLYRASRSTHNSFYSFEQGAPPFEVAVSTIDIYCAEKKITHIDFLKIDVEGHEFPVLRGAEKMLGKKAIDRIQFEFSGATIESRTFLKDFIDLFEKYGYDLYRIRALDIQKVVYFPDRERFTLTNYLAIKRGISVPS